MYANAVADKLSYSAWFEILESYKIFWKFLNTKIHTRLSIRLVCVGEQCYPISFDYTVLVIDSLNKKVAGTSELIRNLEVDQLTAFSMNEE